MIDQTEIFSYKNLYKIEFLTARVTTEIDAKFRSAKTKRQIEQFENIYNDSFFSKLIKSYLFNSQAQFSFSFRELPNKLMIIVGIPKKNISIWTHLIN